MNFYLMRHGDAVPETSDPRRPLSGFGREQVKRVALAAGSRKVEVSAIFHSGILRAEQTAAIMAGHLRPKLDARPMTGLSPQDDPAIAKAELETARESVMIVGHLPHMNRLAGLLINGDADRDAIPFAPATLLCIAHVGSGWQLMWVLSPDFP